MMNNLERAATALVAVKAFMAVNKTAEEVVIADLICNLMHLADQADLYDLELDSFEGSLERARQYYETETKGNDDD